MPNATLTLEQVPTDARTDELAYQLKVHTNGPSPIEIFEIAPRVPDGLTLVDVKDASQEAVQARRNKLFGELTALLQEYLGISVEAFRAKQRDIGKAELKAMLGELSFPMDIFGLYTRMFTGALLKAQQRATERRNALGYEILSTMDADRALAIFLSHPESSEGQLARSIFDAKLEQLKALDGDANHASEALVEIEAGSQFSATYVLRAKRSPVNPRHFRFAVEVRYGTRAEPQRFNTETSVSVVVSPSSPVLLLIAVLGSALGTVLKFAVAQTKPDSVYSFAEKIRQVVLTGPGLSSAVLAVAFFAAFEHSDLFKTGRLALNWRTALVLGVGSGVFADRFLAAFKALLGLGA
jgi:hypothetical protein